MKSLIEEYRQQCVEALFKVSTFSNSFAAWKPTIEALTLHHKSQEYFDLADHLREIFQITNTAGGRTQEAVSGGGACWEALVCWYLNLCCLGRRTVIIKHAKELIPECVSDAITVNYGNFPSNTESDLIAITFPDKPEYDTELESLTIVDDTGHRIQNTKVKNGKNVPNIKGIIDVLAKRDFGKLEVSIIQCKTNWNDNAQIPMLWDMIYSANAFKTNITIGRNGSSIKTISRFSYAFATVPSNKLSLYEQDRTCVKRVENLSGGNYWGCPTKANVAASLKEMLNRNLLAGNPANHLTTLSSSISKLSSDYSYFGLEAEESPSFDFDFTF